VNKSSRKLRRRFAPNIEALEALQLLDGATTAGFLSCPPATAASWVGTVTQSPQCPESPANASWDESLSATSSSEFGLDKDDVRDVSSAGFDPKTVQSGLDQLERYLGRVWSRAGIASDFHEDCTQAVFATLLQEMGRQNFDITLDRVGRSSIPAALPRDSKDGQLFSRALDSVKKRAIREKQYLALEPHADLALSSKGDQELLRDVLCEAINQSLNQREANLIRATLEGFTPSEIAERWGVAAKTISNEKSRALQKLRDVLVA